MSLIKYIDPVLISKCRSYTSDLQNTISKLDEMFVINATYNDITANQWKEVLKQFTDLINKSERTLYQYELEIIDEALRQMTAEVTMGLVYGTFMLVIKVTSEIAIIKYKEIEKKEKSPILSPEIKTYL